MGAIPPDTPAVPCSDFSGYIHAAGKDSGYAVGEEVYGMKFSFDGDFTSLSPGTIDDIGRERNAAALPLRQPILDPNDSEIPKSPIHSSCRTPTGLFDRLHRSDRIRKASIRSCRAGQGQADGAGAWRVVGDGECRGAVGQEDGMQGRGDLLSEECRFRQEAWRGRGRFCFPRRKCT